MKKTILLLVFLVMSQCIVCNAAELDENTGDQTVTINYTVGSSWKVTVPAAISVPASKVAEYDVVAEGSIMNDEEIRVKVLSDTLELAEENGTNSITAEFRTSADGPAERVIGSFNNENTEGNSENEMSGSDTFNQTVTRYVVVTDEVIPAGTYKATCTFAASIH